MAKPNIHITPMELTAICMSADTLSATVGGGDPFYNTEVKKIVKLIDRMLKRNGYKRDFK